MELDHFKNLPVEITISILSRLPLKTIGRCKCVSKPWLDLLETPNFANSHLSKSPRGVIVSQITDSPKKHRYVESMNDRSASFNFTFPKPNRLFGSANGLLFLIEYSSKHQSFCVLNPITRNYISVPYLQRDNSTAPPCRCEMSTFGFGVSKKTGEYKLVKVYHVPVFTEDPGFHYHSECEVYTLGKGKWRSIAPSELLIRRCYPPGLFLNGNFYWLAVDQGWCKSICCFDLETERFSNFSLPCDGGNRAHLSVMEECLCYCYTSAEYDIIVWSMNEDEGVKSWTKKFVISKPRTQSRFYGDPIFCPIAVFKEGDILMGVRGYSRLVNYSNRSKIVEGTDLVTVDVEGLVSAVYYTPSFVSLKPFSRGCDLESF